LVVWPGVIIWAVTARRRRRAFTRVREDAGTGAETRRREPSSNFSINTHAEPQVTLIGAFGESRVDSLGGSILVFTADSTGAAADRPSVLTVFDSGS
jgi:hypothetical protein